MAAVEAVSTTPFTASVNFSTIDFSSSMMASKIGASLPDSVMEQDAKGPELTSRSLF
jgi:hypothetical protein